MIILAPWTDKQVAALNRFQSYGLVHPFTCPGHDGDGDRTLLATNAGWVCRHCSYTQNWAHDLCSEQAMIRRAIYEGVFR
jgi:hypothetical protein